MSPPTGARWLDVGCGTGAFSELIARRCAPASLTGIDPSPEQIAYAREHLPRFRFEVGDSAAMPFADGAFDVVASALVIHFIPDRQKAFAEMKRVLAPGGLVGGYTWKREGMREFAAYAPMMDGIAAIGVAPPHSTPVDESSVDGMRASLHARGICGRRRDRDRGVANVRELRRILGDPDDPVPSRRQGGAKRSTRAQRARLRDHLRATLVAPDGTITYAATAIAGKARKPQ